MTRKRRRPLRRAAVGLERWRSGGSGRRTHSANAAGAAAATHSAPIFVLFSSCETLLPFRRGVGGSDSTRFGAADGYGFGGGPTAAMVCGYKGGGPIKQSVIHRALQGNLHAGRRTVTWSGPMPLGWARCLTAGAVCPLARLATQ